VYHAESAADRRRRQAIGTSGGSTVPTRGRAVELITSGSLRRLHGLSQLEAAAVKHDSQSAGGVDPSSLLSCPKQEEQSAQQVEVHRSTSVEKSAAKAVGRPLTLKERTAKSRARFWKYVAPAQKSRRGGAATTSCQLARSCISSPEWHWQDQGWASATPCLWVWHTCLSNFRRIQSGSTPHERSKSELEPSSTSSLPWRTTD